MYRFCILRVAILASLSFFLMKFIYLSKKIKIKNASVMGMGSLSYFILLALVYLEMKSESKWFSL